MGDGDWLAEVRALPGVVYAKPLVSPGDEVTCSDDGLPTWLGQIMCDAPTPAEAVALVKKYEQMVVPPIIPKGEAVPVLKCKLPVVLTEEDQELLLSATPAGQAHRLSMLRDRVLVFISAGYPGKKFIFEKAQQLGVLSVIIDNPGTWSAELVTTGARPAPARRPPTSARAMPAPAGTMSIRVDSRPTSRLPPGAGSFSSGIRSGCW